MSLKFCNFSHVLTDHEYCGTYCIVCIHYIQFLWVLFIAPCQIILAVYLLYQQIGWSVFVAIGTQIIFVAPLQICVGGKVRKLQTLLMKQRDKRFKMVNELFSAMKIGMYSYSHTLNCSSSLSTECLNADYLKI